MPKINVVSQSTIPSGGTGLTRKYHSIIDSDPSILASRPIVDSSGAFLQSELELLDPKLHLPLTWTTFSEDLLPRTGFTIDDEFVSWTNSTFGATDNLGLNTKSWLGLEGQDSPEIAVDIFKQVNAPGIWSKSASWTFVELSRAAKLQRPIDVDKLEAIQKAWNLDADNQAYLGDPKKNLFGIANASVADGNTKDWAVTESINSTLGGWAALLASSPSTAPDLILNDLRLLDEAIWANSGYTSPATRFLIPSSVWAILNIPLVITGVPIAMSIRNYFETTASIAASMGRKVTLVPRKWLNSSIPGTGYGNTLAYNRVVGYVDEYDYVRFEYTPLISTPIWVLGMRQAVTYYGNLGGVEIVYPGTVGYLSQV